MASAGSASAISAAEPASSDATGWASVRSMIQPHMRDCPSELRRRPEVACDEAAAQTSDPADDPEASFEIKHRGEIVRDCLSRLSRAHREVIDLVYYHEKSVQEAAAILGVPGNTVKTRMFHARKNLSELLAARGVVGALA